eukprot:jgi/Picsp_1/1843/NSC_05310-R1_hypothetical protein CHLNCDRAFT_132907 [Chlorella variabilis]
MGGAEMNGSRDMGEQKDIKAEYILRTFIPGMVRHLVRMRSLERDVLACEEAVKSAGLGDIVVKGPYVYEEEVDYNSTSYNLGPGDGENVCCAALVLCCLWRVPLCTMEVVLGIPWEDLQRDAENWIAGDFFCRKDDFAHREGCRSEATRKVMQRLVNGELDSVALNGLMDHVYMFHDIVLPNILFGRSQKNENNSGSQQYEDDLFTRGVLMGCRPVHAAAMSGSVEHLKFLIDLGADTLCKTCSGYYPFELVPTCFWSGCVRSSLGFCGCSQNGDLRTCQSGGMRYYLSAKTAVSVFRRLSLWNSFIVLFMLLGSVLNLWCTSPSRYDRNLLHYGLLSIGNTLRRDSFRIQTLQKLANIILDYCTSQLKVLDGDRTRLLKEDIATEYLEKPCVLNGYQVPSGSDSILYKGLKYYRLAFMVYDKLKYVREYTPVHSKMYRSSITKAKSADDLVAEYKMNKGLAYLHALHLEVCNCSDCYHESLQVIDRCLSSCFVLSLNIFSSSADLKKSQQIHVLECFGVVIQSKAKLLILTAMKQSARIHMLWRAQECLSEWKSFKMLLKNSAVGEMTDPFEIECLEEWTQAVEADFGLTRSFIGRTLDPSTSLDTFIGHLRKGRTALNTSPENDEQQPRAVDLPTLKRLETEFAKSRDVGSPHLIRLIEDVLDNCRKEYSLLQSLDDILHADFLSPSMQEEREKVIKDAIHMGEEIPLLRVKAKEAEKHCIRTLRRSDMQENLSKLVAACEAISANQDLPDVLSDIDEKIQQLESCISDARDLKLNTSRAKKALKDVLLLKGGLEFSLEAKRLLALDDVSTGQIQVLMEEANTWKEQAQKPSLCLATLIAHLDEILFLCERRKLLQDVFNGLKESLCIEPTVHLVENLAKQLELAKQLNLDVSHPATMLEATELLTRIQKASNLVDTIKNRIKELAALIMTQKEEEVLDVSKDLDELFRHAEEYGTLTEPVINDLREKKQMSMRIFHLSQDMHNAISSAETSKTIKDAISKASGMNVDTSHAQKIYKAAQSLESAIQSAKTALQADRNVENSISTVQNRISYAEKLGISSKIVDNAKVTLKNLLFENMRKNLIQVLQKDESSSASVSALTTEVLKEALDKVHRALQIVQGLDISNLQPQPDSNGNATPPLVREVKKFPSLQSNDSTVSRCSTSPILGPFSSDDLEIVPPTQPENLVEVCLQVVDEKYVAVWFECPYEPESQSEYFRFDGEGDIESGDILELAAAVQERLIWKEHKQARQARLRVEEARVRHKFIKDESKIVTGAKCHVGFSDVKKKQRKLRKRRGKAALPDINTVAAMESSISSAERSQFSFQNLREAVGSPSMMSTSSEGQNISSPYRPILEASDEQGWHIGHVTETSQQVLPMDLKLNFSTSGFADYWSESSHQSNLLDSSNIWEPRSPIFSSPSRPNRDSSAISTDDNGNNSNTYGTPFMTPTLAFGAPGSNVFTSWSTQDEASDAHNF